MKIYMKKITVLLFLMGFSFYGWSQSALPKGNRIPKSGNAFIDFGVGVSSWGVPIYVGAEWMVHEEVSVGGQVLFQSQSESYDETTYRHNAFTMAARGNYIFNRLLEIPAPYLFYAGATLGFVTVSTNHSGPGVDYSGSRGSGLFFGVQTGGSYFFNKNWAANIELGVGNIFGLKLGAKYLF